MQSDRVLTLHHAMDSDFFVNTVQVFLTNVCYLYNFASIDLLCRVNSRPDSLLLPWSTFLLFHDIRCQLCFAYFTILALTKYIIDKDDKSVHFSDLRLPNLTPASHVDSS